jgi:sortase A
MKKRPSKLRRRVEIALWILGVSLLGVASGDVLFRWIYQMQQERAFERRPALVVPTEVAAAPNPAPTIAENDTRGLALAFERSVLTESRDTVAPIEHEAPPPPPRPVKKKRAPVDPDADPTAVGRIEIPRLGVFAFVKEGADSSTLARAVGLVPGTAHPGEPGNMVLAGHRDTFFRPLRKIKLNDRIRMIVPPNTYEYRVQSMRVVEPEERGVLASKGIEELTLVTCYPFRFIGSAPERFIVSAMRVN